MGLIGDIRGLSDVRHESNDYGGQRVLLVQTVSYVMQLVKSEKNNTRPKSNQTHNSKCWSDLTTKYNSTF